MWEAIGTMGNAEVVVERCDEFSDEFDTEVFHVLITPPNMELFVAARKDGQVHLTGNMVNMLDYKPYDKPQPRNIDVNAHKLIYSVGWERLVISENI